MPRVPIKLGPFVDSDHPEIKRGAVDATFDEVFETEILGKLKDYAEYMGSEARVVLVPSIRDANHDFVFPQPPFDIHMPEHEDQVRSVSNPGTLEANQVKVGWCSVDVLKQLSGEEYGRRNTSERMGRLASHLLRQGCFYPLHPPSHTLPLDHSLSPHALLLSSLPHLLILPSDMRFFLKELEVSEGEGKCVCVNPGRLSKGEGGGTFAELLYSSAPPSLLRASVISI